VTLLFIVNFAIVGLNNAEFIGRNIENVKDERKHLHPTKVGTTIGRGESQDSCSS
jgi:hypothetical protein